MTTNKYSGYKKSKVVIVPVPYEKTTSYGKGAKNGPKAIIDAIDKVERYDIQEDAVLGEISVMPFLKNIDTSERLFKEIKHVTNKILKDKKLPVYLGGEHTITAACVSAFKNFHTKFSVLHFDAHSDLRDTYGGTKYSHGCVMRRVLEMGLPVVSVGIRSQSYEEHKFITNVGADLCVCPRTAGEHPETAGEHIGSPLHIFYAHNILGKTNWIKEVIKSLDNKFYLTFDVDVMDPACLPATGTPEPGGFMWQEMAGFLERLADSGKELIGMDMVELSPIKALHASDFLCAKLICKIMALVNRRA